MAISTTFWFKWTNQLPYSNEEQTYLGPPAHYIQKVFFLFVPSQFCQPPFYQERHPYWSHTWKIMPQRSQTSFFCVTAGVCWEVQCDLQLAFDKKSCGPMLLITLGSASRSLLRWFKTCPPFSVNLFSSGKKKTMYIYIYLMHGRSGDCGTDVIPLDHVPIVWCLTETWVLLADGHKPLLSWKGTCGSLLPWWQMQMSALKANKDTLIPIVEWFSGNIPLTNQTIWKCCSTSFPST